MNSKNNSQKPYLELGSKLKHLRENNNETLLDVSGAVEIDSILLAKYESGHVRPSEDILLLLISHFNAKDEVASKLWKLAGYNEPPETEKAPAEQVSIRHDIVIVPMDPRVIYSDKAQVMVNDYGLVINFLQSGNKNSLAMPISRVGMSKEHAKSLLKILSMTLKQSEIQAKNSENKLGIPRTGADETPKK